MRSSGVQTISAELVARRNPVGFPSDSPDMASFSSNAPTMDIWNKDICYELQTARLEDSMYK